MSKHMKVLLAVVLVVTTLLIGAGVILAAANEESVAGTATPTNGFADTLVGIATDDEVDCVRHFSTGREAMKCLSLDTLVAMSGSYLGQETDATSEQVSCVGETLREMGVVKARRVTFSGIGAAAYVPCGLPD